MNERRAGQSWLRGWVSPNPPPLAKASSRLRAALIAGAALVAAAVAVPFIASGGANLCYGATYQKHWPVDCTTEGGAPAIECWGQAYYCADDTPVGDPNISACGTAACSNSTDSVVSCWLGVSPSEICDDAIDNDGDGCVDEGCTAGEGQCTCQTSCDSPSCTYPRPTAECDPSKGKTELCGDGEDNDCDDEVDEGCDPAPEPPPPSPPPAPPPPPRPDPKCCECNGGEDPILLATRTAATTPFTDFAVSAGSRLSVTRTWNSRDASLFGGSVGVLGRGWHHEWEGTLSCSGDVCRVARGAHAGSSFLKAERVLSLDGSETWQLYRPRTGSTGVLRRQLLAQRPSGEWIYFLSDGRTMHFATACDACGAPDRFCQPPEAGGLARLVKVVDPQGNAVHVGYGRNTGLLLGLTDDLGHSLELKSATACTDGLARELFYDGVRVATYEFSGLDLTRAVDADGAVLRSYAYDPEGTGRLWAILDEAGLPGVEFSYDANGEATGIADEATTMLIEYGANGVVTVSEAYGSNTSIGTRTFDSAGRPLSVSAGCSCGGVRTYTYTGGDRTCTTNDDGTRIYEERDSQGRIKRYVRYTGTQCPPYSVSWADQEEGRTYGLTKAIAQGVTLTLDAQLTNSRTSALLPPNKATETWDYDASPKAGDPVGYSCAEAPLPAGAVVCRYIQAGYATSTSGTLSERHATFYSHDSRGRVTKVIGPVNLDRPSPSDVVPVEEYIYWPDAETPARRGRLAETRRYPSLTAAPLQTTFDYDMFGLYRTWQPDGRVTTWLKDGRGRATHVIESDGRTSETRFHDGEKPRLRISAGGEVDRTGYDSRGRVTAEERLSGDPDVPGAQVTVLWGEYHSYDPAGNRVHSERRDASGAVIWKQDREFDVQHRLVKETHPEVAGAFRSWEYDVGGFLTRTTDEEGRATTFLPEYLGRVLSVTRRGVDANGAPISLKVASYGYQSYSGRLSSVTDAKGTGTTYRYDDFGRLEQLNNSGMRASWIKSLWDARGNLLQRKDQYVTKSHTYDGLDRLLQSTASNAWDQSSVTYTNVYDEGGALERLTKVIEPERTIRFTFDSAGRLATERLEENGVSVPLVTEHRYDAAGRFSELVYPTGLRLAYDRDPVTHEVIALRNADTGLVYAGGVTRLGAGPVASLTYANGATLSQTFNKRWEPTSVVTGPANLQYTPTPAGDVGRIVENGLTLPFSYDFLDRLTGSTGWFTYGYDGNGNRSSEWLEGSSLTYSYSYDRLKDASTPGTTPVKRYAFAYDYQTNLTGIGKFDAAGVNVTSATCLRHDPLGRLVAVGPSSMPSFVTPDAVFCTSDWQLASVTARFKYDHRNRRVASWRSATNEWVYTVFDQAGQPLAELAKTTNPAAPWRTVREYVWLDGKPVAQIERDAAGSPRVYAVHTDAIGMPRALTSPTGATVWTASVARPYGDVGETTTPDPETGRTVVTNLRLPGQYDERLLASLGFRGPYYNWNRWYMATVGRYLEMDPIVKAGGFSTAYGPAWYAYAGGNPLFYIDPWGLIHWNKPPPATVPVTGDALQAIQCTESCLKGKTCNSNLDLLLTGGQEQSGHSQNSHHYINQAVDIAGPNFNQVTTAQVLECAKQCGFGAGFFESYPNNSNRDHWHVQINPGNGVPAIPSSP